MKKILAVIYIGSLFGGSLCAQVTDVDRFEKPLRINPVVSGSFGELRSNHFHSGMDLTTHGKTGYRVYASDAGYVSRIKVQAGGYGKAVYIDHPGGYTTVYAHLENYEGRIAAKVKELQYAQESFEVEQYFKPGELPVERGEVVGYSGNSGSSGGPHLHYEIRLASTQEPIDPMNFRDDIKDDVKPQIQGLKLYALSSDALVNGARKDSYFSVVHYNGQFYPKGQTTISGYGALGVGVQVLDYLSDSWRKCGVSSIELYANDTLVFHSVMDKFSFAETRYINAHIDYPEKSRTGRVIQRSFRLPNNPLSIYRKADLVTVNIMQGDRKQMKYLIRDVSGNTSELNITLIGEAPKQLPVKEETNMRLSYSRAYHLDTLGVRIDIPAFTLYEDCPLLIHRGDVVPNAVGPAYTIGDDANPVHSSITYRFEVSPELMGVKDKLVVAGVTPTNKLFSWGGSYANGEVTAKIRTFGRFTLAVDTIAPKISVVDKPADNNYTARKHLVLEITDELSGIDTYKCTVNGAWALFEYDAKTNRLSGSFEDIPSLVKGKNELVASVVDAKGNKSQLKVTFTR